MKKTIIFSALFAFLTIFAACKNEEVTPGQQKRASSGTVSNPETVLASCDPVVSSFMAGKHFHAGNITVTNDLTNLYIAINMIGNWKMRESHVYAGPLSGLPVNNSGNPKIGNFPYKATHNPVTSQYIYTIPLSALGSEKCIAIATHAAVGEYDAAGNGSNGQTAWGAGNAIKDGGSWATYFTYCICETDNTNNGNNGGNDGNTDGNNTDNGGDGNDGNNGGDDGNTDGNNGTDEEDIGGGIGGN